jgi:hypothetical protein
MAGTSGTREVLGRGGGVKYDATKCVHMKVDAKMFLLKLLQESVVGR